MNSTNNLGGAKDFEELGYHFSEMMKAGGLKNRKILQFPNLKKYVDSEYVVKG